MTRGQERGFSSKLLKFKLSSHIFQIKSLFKHKYRVNLFEINISIVYNYNFNLFNNRYIGYTSNKTKKNF